ncbi:hypothetical protein NDA16_003195 [Ustilago loliicola]|nr:hypothetical protein NDA16_003195 [Ustilago loliicola]
MAHHPHRFLLILLALLAVVSSPVTFAWIPSPDQEAMWKHAYKRYINLHMNQHIEFEPRDGDLHRYKRIRDLEWKALEIGRERGVLFVGKTQGRLPHQNALFFSTLIRPGDPLGQSMNLQNKVALALFKKDLKGTRLIDLDTMTHNGVNWPLKPFRDVVGILY